MSSAWPICLGLENVGAADSKCAIRPADGFSFERRTQATPFQSGDWAQLASDCRRERDSRDSENRCYGTCRFESLPTSPKISRIRRSAARDRSGRRGQPDSSQGRPPGAPARVSFARRYISDFGRSPAGGTFAGANSETPCVVLGGASAPSRLTSAIECCGLRFLFNEHRISRFRGSDSPLRTVFPRSGNPK